MVIGLKLPLKPLEFLLDEFFFFLLLFDNIRTIECISSNETTSQAQHFFIVKVTERSRYFSILINLLWPKNFLSAPGDDPTLSIY